MRLAFFAPLGVFLAVQLTLSLAFPTSFLADDADQIFFSQSLAWGYHEQPPLYTWLTWLAFQLFGCHAPVLHVFKTVLLGLLYTLVYLNARLLLGDGWRAVLAAFSPLLIPAFAWHTIFHWTHTNLACILSLLTLYVFLRLQREGRWRDYLLLGLVLGLGMLSKYNYLVFAGALLLAGCTVRSFRARLLSRRLLGTAAVSLVVLGPHALWVAEHGATIKALVAHKTRITEDGHSLAGVAMAGTRLGQNVLAIAGPVLGAFLFFLPHSLRRTSAPADEPTGDVNRLFERFFPIAAGLLLLQAVAAGITEIHDRWLQPVGLLVPLYLFCRLRDVELPRVRLRRFAYALAGIAVVLIVGRLGQIQYGKRGCGFYPLQMAFAEAARDIEATTGKASAFVATDRVLAANLRACFPEARHWCIDYPLYAPPHDVPGPCVLVWNTAQGEAPPADLREYVARQLHVTVPPGAPVSFVEVRSRATGGRTNRLGYLVVPAPVEPPYQPPAPTGPEQPSPPSRDLVRA